MTFILPGIVSALALVSLYFYTRILKRSNREKQIEKDLQRLKLSLKRYDGLLHRSYPIPSSKTLNSSLTKRCFFIAEAMADLRPKDTNIIDRFNESKIAVKALSLPYTPANGAFKVPKSSQECISILKRIKALKVAINNERKMGVLNIEDSNIEIARLDQLKLQVHIENLKYRISQEKRNGRLTTANDLVKMGLTALSNENCDYSIEQKEHFLYLLESVKIGLNDEMALLKQLKTEKAEAI
ncbi:hypothetical protein L4D20_13280 [Vibrio kyushuensis]|uniref:hypothetical protein n=1 Tax=Vibrio kyushuensis TaxID=2910249 RepID=UPI003D0E68F2